MKYILHQVMLIDIADYMIKYTTLHMKWIGVRVTRHICRW